MDIIRHPHHEMFEFVFCIAAMRNADNLEKLHELSTNVLKIKLKGAIVQMAEHVGRLQSPMTTEKQTVELKSVKREHWRVPTTIGYACVSPASEGAWRRKNCSRSRRHPIRYSAKKTAGIWFQAGKTHENICLAKSKSWMIRKKE
ncbi:MAG: hypothetical protein K5787_21005 [Lentisphaeria bacterium]|nr:hypothetical protein [Victivallales bacterium]MCR4576244.1 hypothetical protein [Lentisphaeria bacterium]